MAQECLAAMRQGETPVSMPNTRVKALPADDTRPRGPEKQEAARQQKSPASDSRTEACPEGTGEGPRMNGRQSSRTARRRGRAAVYLENFIQKEN